jgi:hypothetical protein
VVIVGPVELVDAQDPGADDDHVGLLVEALRWHCQFSSPITTD